MNRNMAYALAFVTLSTACFAVDMPVPAGNTDDLIESSFRNTYVYRTFLTVDSIKVKANDGVVTLRGTVVNECHKILAHETASNLAGVTRVNSQLSIKAAAADNTTDTWIGTKINLALLFHRNVNAGKTLVDVKAGVVTLKGEAANAAQKDLTTEYAKDIDGVVKVINEMTIASDPESDTRTADEIMDDASVTAQVKTALSTHRSTSAIPARVISRNGEVTLTGMAGNEAEKALVARLVADIRGVSTVINQMTIQSTPTR